MKSSSSARGPVTTQRVTRNLGIMVAAGLLSGLSSAAALAQTAAPAAKEPAPAATTAKPTAEELENWRQSILNTPQPTNGCFTANYPDAQWHEVPCKEPPHKPLNPRHGPSTSFGQVGNGQNDLSATPKAGNISRAEGSFEPGTNVTSECAVQCPGPNFTCPANPVCAPGAATEYSLQLNTNTFAKAKACQNSPNYNTPLPNACQAWEQFVYENSGSVYIQSWLINYGPNCPAPISANCALGGVWTDGWCPFPTAPGTVDCARNGLTPGATAEPMISSMSGIILDGAVPGVLLPNDAAMVTTPGGAAAKAAGGNYFTDLGSNWTAVEFNVFGDGGGDQAVFNAGATVIVRTGLDSGTKLGPGCELQSFTGESNNLTLANAAVPAAETVLPAGATKMPALIFGENDNGGTQGNCLDATSHGDTHLLTFDGLKYDFQGSGDFLLAQSGSDFIVQTRQTLAVTEPNWIKNATINKAVAVQMGKSRVAVYIDPTRLVIDGQRKDLGDGKTLGLPTGVQVSLKDSVYVITDPSGDRVSATLNNNGINTWLDIAVGLGKAPGAQTRGLLGDATSSSYGLKTADGRLLTSISFADLYHSYADGWRVQPNEALLDRDPTAAPGVPDKPLFASDLDANTAQRVRALCTAAGVTAPALLDDCMLDVAVLGGADDTAARVYTRVALPRAVLPRPAL